MDNFMDRLAQKFASGEIIRTNHAAGEREWKKLREQVAEYERCLQELRELQLGSMEAAESLRQLMEESGETIRGLSSSGLDRLIQSIQENQRLMEEKFKQADDYLHKENVKVYRNIQAVVVEEAQKKTEIILAAQEKVAAGYYRKAMCIMALTFLAAAAGVVLQLMY